MDEKMKYKVLMQTKDGMTIEATLLGEHTHESARQIVLTNPVLMITKAEAENFVLQPIATEEDWKEGTYQFCPRCGKHLDTSVYSGESMECFNCNCSITCDIDVYGDEE